MMKGLVLKRFFDKESQTHLNVGDQFELTDERLDQIRAVEDKLGINLVKISDDDEDPKDNDDVIDDGSKDDGEDPEDNDDAIDDGNKDDGEDLKDNEDPKVNDESSPVDFENMTVVDLRAYAKEKEITLKSGASKAEIIEYIKG